MGYAPILPLDAILSRHRLSREQFCAVLKISMRTLDRWAGGNHKPSLSICKQASDKFGIDVFELRPDLWSHYDAVLARHGIKREAFCRRLGIGMPTFRSWTRGDRLPGIEVCRAAEVKLGIPKHELRPDLWPPPAGAPRTQVRLTQNKRGGMNNGERSRVAG